VHVEHSAGTRGDRDDAGAPDLAFEASGLAASHPGELRTRLQHHLDVLHADGVVGAVGQVSDGHERIAAHSGVARLDGTTPVSFDAQFRMGSNTKTFVAVVMLQLVDEGKVRLSDTIDRWLPGVVSGHGNDGTQITIRNLLQHTSGINNYTQELLAGYTAAEYYATRFRHYDPEQLVAIAVAQPPNFAPGTGWSYSNTNYILAGMIIKKVTGHDWSTEVNARILAPLQMLHTFDPRDQRPRIAGVRAIALCRGYMGCSRGASSKRICARYASTVIDGYTMSCRTFERSVDSTSARPRVDHTHSASGDRTGVVERQASSFISGVPNVFSKAATSGSAGRSTEIRTTAPSRSHTMSVSA